MNPNQLYLPQKPPFEFEPVMAGSFTLINDESEKYFDVCHHSIWKPHEIY